MLLSRWLRNGKIDNLERVARRTRRSTHQFEVLEDRCTPANFVVNTVADAVPSLVGSLRRAIEDANSPSNLGLDTISFNVPGSGVQTMKPVAPLPAITDSVVIDGYTQPGSSQNTNSNGFNAVLKIQIDGSLAGTSGASGLWFQTGGNTVRGLVINRFILAGIFLNATTIAGNNVIEGNILGTDAAGTTAIGNGANIYVLDSDNTIGGATPAARNVISGAHPSVQANVGIGLGIGNITAIFRNTIVGNFIGTDPTGTHTVGQAIGVQIFGKTQDTRVGGTTTAERNIISGNAAVGVLINNSSSYHHVVQGNYIGTDVTGTFAVPNVGGYGGLGIAGSTTSLIGGAAPGAGNVISGNGSTGITVITSTSSHPVIQGNRIGVNAFGNALGNSSDGIVLNGSDAQIGGAAAGEGNLIAHNGGDGIVYAGSDSGARFFGNVIRNNGKNGISASSATNAPPKLVGGRNPGEGNVITANLLTGVNLFGTRIEVVGNSIYANGRLGICLTGTPAPLANDTNDVDTGTNLFQNYPKLTAALTGANATIKGTLNSVAGTTFKLDFYASSVTDPTGYGEGQRYLGSATVATLAGSNDVTFSVALPGTVSVGEFVTATATDSGSNTSEFSFARVVAATDIVGRDENTGAWNVGKSNGTSFATSSFGAWSPGAIWADLLTGDFNGDGRQDVVGRYAAAGQWYVGLSTGTTFATTYWTTWSTGVTWADVKVGDFNKDGKDDIAGRWKETGNWYVGLSTGTAFTTSYWGTWSTGITWADVAVGDFNADGRADIVGRYMEAGQWYVGLSTGTAFATSYWAGWSAGITWADVKVGDFDGDGKSDIIGRHAETGNWYAGISTATSFATAYWTTWSVLNWVDVNVGDFNGDAKADIAGRWKETGNWYVGLSTGSALATSYWGQWTSSLTWADVQVGDFDGDGKSDLVGRWKETGQWYVARSTGTAFVNANWATWSPNVTWTDVNAANFA